MTTKSVVDKIGFIVNSIRDTGTVEVVDGAPADDLGCDYVIDCKCDHELENGTYEYTKLMPYYYFGDLTEIQERLDSKKNKNKPRTPAVILEQPFVNKIYKNQFDNPTLKLYIVKSEKHTKDYPYRYQNNFPNTLHPLWDDLFKAIKKSRLITNFEIIEVNEYPKQDLTRVTSENWDLLEIKLKLLFNDCEEEVCKRLIYN